MTREEYKKDTCPYCGAYLPPDVEKCPKCEASIYEDRELEEFAKEIELEESYISEGDLEEGKSGKEFSDQGSGKEER